MVERFKLFLERVPVQEETTTEPKSSKMSMPSSLFDYKSKLNKLNIVVQQIKNKNNFNYEPSATDKTFLEEMAKEVTNRMPTFLPKYPGFHTYDKLDSLAQAYIQYLPQDFKREEYAAIWTTPNGRKCPSSEKWYPIPYATFTLKIGKTVCNIITYSLSHKKIHTL